MYMSLDKSLYILLEKLAQKFNEDKKLNKELFGKLGPINGIINIKTVDDSVDILVEIENGKFIINHSAFSKRAQVAVIFESKDLIEKYLKSNPDEKIRLILASKLRLEGNVALFGYFNYLISFLTWKEDIKAFAKETLIHKQENIILAKKAGLPDRKMKKERIKGRLKADKIDPGVHYLKDPYLSKYLIEDFPRLIKFKKERQNIIPEVTAEQGKLLTDYYVKNGFLTDENPILQRARAFKYLMEKKKPLLRKDDLIAGTITPNPICGSINQPYTVGWSIWGEMKTLKNRELDPFYINEETEKILSKYVFPYWMDKYIQQVWKEDNNYPFPAKIYDKMFCYNFWSVVSPNPGSPGFEKVVKVGLKAFREEIEDKLKNKKASKDQKESWKAMLLAIEGITLYTKNHNKNISKKRCLKVS